MSTSKLKIGITGASGNIGKTLRDGLKNSYDLFLFDIRNKGVEPEEKFKIVDFSNKESMKDLFSGLNILIHLAGDPRPDAPAESTLRNNFRATSYVFEQAYKDGVEKIIFASSNFYHESDIMNALHRDTNKMITLDKNPTPMSLYGQSKVFGEYTGLHYFQLGMKFIALRIGWTIPEDDPTRYDGEYMRAIFTSKRDLVQAFVKAIETDKQYLSAFAISNNDRKVFSLEETKSVLGFKPVDNCESYFEQ